VERGGTVATVAQRYGVNPGTLGWWRSRLRREQREAETVELVPAVLRGGSGGPREIELGVAGVHVRVAVNTVGTDVSYVAALIAALRAC
jgi:hypothetical protein